MRPGLACCYLETVFAPIAPTLTKPVAGARVTLRKELEVREPGGGARLQLVVGKLVLGTPIRIVPPAPTATN